MFNVILKTTNSSFPKKLLLCLSIYLKKVIKLLAFIFQQPSYDILFLLNIFAIYVLMKLCLYFR